jgi:hypothetical protein
MEGPTDSQDPKEGATPESLLDPTDELGCQLIVQLNELFQKLGSESLQMELVVSELGALRRTLTQLARHLREGPRLTVQGRTFFVCNRPVQLDLNCFKLAQELRGSWKTIRMGELIFPGKTTDAALAGFAAMLNKALFDPRQAAPLYGKKNPGQVRARPMPRDPAKESRVAGGRRVVSLYGSLMLLLRYSVEQLQQGKTPPMRQLRRAIKELMESMGRNGGLMLALCYSPEARRWPEAASVATMMHALVVGQLLSFPRQNLLELGLAALLADVPHIGGADCEARMPLLEEALEDDPELLSHLLTLNSILEGPGLKVGALAPAVVLHEGPDIFSRPDRYACNDADLRRPFLYSRIIAVCSLYDQLVWPWREEAAERTTEQRVALWNQVMQELDPVVVRVFIEFMGLFPIGSIVELETHEIGVVVAQRKGNPDRPMVLTVIDTEAGLRVSGPVVDLAKETHRRILGLADASRLGINPVACFASRGK